MQTITLSDEAMRLAEERAAERGFASAAEYVEWLVRGEAELAAERLEKLVGEALGEEASEWTDADRAEIESAAGRRLGSASVANVDALLAEAMASDVAELDEAEWDSIEREARALVAARQRT